jgi:protein-S-isoprenylcysteine O-methyltransferase Ste14
MIAFWAVIGCWLALTLGTVLRKRPPQAREVKRGRRWASGLVLQSLSIALIWALRRPGFPGGGRGPVVETLAVLLAAASVAVMVWSQRALGRQFAYEARLVENHRLITSGPYRFVRNPIYTAFYGLGLGTALVYSHWLAIPLFTALYAAGTALRVRSEERLLREAFGAEFDEYARRVPALIPGFRY